MALFVTPTSYQQRRIDFFEIVTPADLLRAVVAESPNQNLPISGKDTLGVFKRHVVAFLKFNCGGARYDPSALTIRVTGKREWLSAPADRSYGCPGDRGGSVCVPSPSDQIFSFRTILDEPVAALRQEIYSARHSAWHSRRPPDSARSTEIHRDPKKCSL